MSASYLTPNAALPYCKGCGHAQVLRALGEALERLQIAPHDLAIVTDIGCVGLADAQFATPHTVHTTHGRSTAFAAGMALADGSLGSGRLKTVVMIGDGGAMIGLNHLVNAALLNPDVTVIVHNNFLFGMTGGQNSAFTPLDFVTSTTRAGNATPPLDLARLLAASRASFVARKIAGDRDLSVVIARAIAHPGFAVVEVLELCTAYATRWNAVTGTHLRALAADAGYELGVLTEQPRPVFAARYAEKASELKTRRKPPTEAAEISLHRAQLSAPASLVIAGTAGEHVQSSAALLAQAAMRSGLCVTQKNDNPVTQGTGFSVTELILSPEEVLYTGIETPDVVLVISADGARELERNGAFERVTESTLVLADAEVPLPDLPCQVVRHAFRKEAGPKLASLVAIACWLADSRALPLTALWAALDAKYGEAATAMRARIEHLFVSA